MKKLQKLAVAVSLVLVAGNAAAALTTPGDTTTPTPSSVLFAAKDTNTASANYLHTFIFDLSLDNHSGLNYNSFLNGTEGAGSGLSWNLNNISAFSGFANDVSSLTWSVVAGFQQDQATQTNPTTWGALSTGVKPGDFKPTVSANISNSLVSTASIGKWISLADAALTTAGAATNALDQAQFSATKSYYDQYFPNLGALAASGTQAPNKAGVGSDNFYWITNDGSSGTNSISQLGTFALGANGTLTYSSAASAVPLPAGAWLFLSGLMGVMGLKRRNQQAGA